MELKKCARCGKFFASDVDVCHECEKKDLADLSKLKDFFADNYVVGVSKNEISSNTGISTRNLNRYLGYEEFSGIYIKDNNNDNEELANSKFSL
jgi:RNA polymerase subunit RPABC4/transcription elongation factor Spt4